MSANPNRRNAEQRRENPPTPRPMSQESPEVGPFQRIRWGHCELSEPRSSRVRGTGSFGAHNSLFSQYLAGAVQMLVVRPLRHPCCCQRLGCEGDHPGPPRDPPAKGGSSPYGREAPPGPPSMRGPLRDRPNRSPCFQGTQRHRQHSSAGSRQRSRTLRGRVKTGGSRVPHE